MFSVLCKWVCMPLRGAFAYPYSGVWPLEWPFSVSFALQETGGNTIMTAHGKLTDELQPTQMLAR